MSIFKECDIRGIYPSEITARDAWNIGRALSGMLPEGGRFRVGGDMRLSTPELKRALIDGLVRGGVRVDDLGLIPTPALYFALSRGDCDSGATVTASHNPPEYNGIKFMLGGEPVTPEVIGELRRRVEQARFPEGAGSVRQVDVLPEYLASLRGRFHAVRPLKVLVDAGSGAMSDLAPRALADCGYRVEKLFCEMDGSFPCRNPNPADFRSLTAACREVVERGCDFGVAFDGDGDRAVFVDGLGRPVKNEKALALFVRHLLAGHPTPVVYDQKSSSVVRRAVEAMGGTPVPERSGHAFIKRRFLSLSAAVAGEVSGHFFFGELGYDDGLFAALMMAEILGESGRTLKELADEIACPPITPDLRAACPYALQDECLARVEALGRRLGGDIHHLDGVRLEFADGWALIRKSVTAEQITLRVEADTPDRLSELREQITSALPEAVADALRLA